jgi:hypothetical protein
VEIHPIRVVELYLIRLVVNDSDPPVRETVSVGDIAELVAIVVLGITKGNNRLSGQPPTFSSGPGRALIHHDLDTGAVCDNRGSWSLVSAFTATEIWEKKQESRSPDAPAPGDAFRGQRELGCHVDGSGESKLPVPAQSATKRHNEDAG